MKYTVKFYGWEMDAKGFSLSDMQVQQVKDLMKENDVGELWEIRGEMEDIGINLWDEGDLFNILKPFYNDTFWGQVKDENENVVLEIDYKDLGDIYDHLGDDDEQYSYESYMAIPKFLDNTDNVLLIVDENKGGLFESSFDSDTVPTSSDFYLMGGSIESPDGDWVFISRVFFKDQELEPVDYLDNSGKSSTVEIYRKNGETIV